MAYGDGIRFLHPVLAQFALRDQPQKGSAMKRRIALGLSLLAAGLLAGCASPPGGPGWVTLIDGDKGLENWNRIGDANWRAEGGAIVADKGKGGFLVSKAAYQDFVIYAEFWADTDTNSGIFIRATDPGKIAGCAFASRCPHALERCRAAVPPLATIADGHASACILPPRWTAAVAAGPASRSV